jgi:hypothetical protein
MCCIYCDKFFIIFKICIPLFCAKVHNRRKLSPTIIRTLKNLLVNVVFKYIQGNDKVKKSSN